MQGSTPKVVFSDHEKRGKVIPGSHLMWNKDMNPAFLEILLGTMAFFTFVMAARSEVSTGKVSPQAPQYQRNGTQANNAGA